MSQRSALTAMREDKNLTLTELARRAGIGVSRLYMIETGQRPAPPNVADAIAQEVGTDRASLFVPRSFTVRQGEASVS